MSNSSENIVELGRMSSLSDSVFAFALTLLVLEIRVPDTTQASQLPATLLALVPKLLIYLISFAVIGGAWGSHQRMLGQIKRGDGLFVWLNLLSLLFITFLPASAMLLGQFPNDVLAVAVFAVNVIMIQLSARWLWRHGSKHGLINPALDPRVVTGIGRRLSLGALAFTGSLVFALLSTNLVYVVWVGLFILLFVTDWLSWEQTLLIVQSSIALDGATRGNIDINHGAGVLHITADAADNVLAAGTFGGLDSTIAHNGDLIEAHLQVPKKLGFMSIRYPWAWGPASMLDWNMSVNPHIPLELHIKTSADDINVDLTNAHVTLLNYDTAGSSTVLVLPEGAGQTAVNIHARGASLTVTIPTGVAARIYSINSISNIEIDPTRYSKIESGIGYVSHFYDSAADRIEIQLDLQASFVKFV